MNIIIAGVHMDVGAALKTHAQSKMDELNSHFGQVNEVHITFAHEAHHHNLHNVLMLVHASGVMLRAEGQGIDWYAALDDAVAKLNRQLVKYKGRLAQQRERHAAYKEQRKDLGPLAFEEIHVAEQPTSTEPGAIPAEIFRDFAPEIHKKEVTHIAPMNVDDAVMQMDLLHKPAFMFLNAETGEMNMVYREGSAAEGKSSIRWVAPKA